MNFTEPEPCGTAFMKIYIIIKVIKAKAEKSENIKKGHSVRSVLEANCSIIFGHNGSITAYGYRIHTIKLIGFCASCA